MQVSIKELFQGIFVDLKQETDRSCALLASAYLDGLLMSGIRERLRGRKKDIDELFHGMGILNSFGARIRIAYAIGYIGDDERTDFDIIRAIRNKFAHIPSRISFDTQSIRDQCNNLILGKLLEKLSRSGEPIFEDSPKNRYIFTSQLRALGLFGRLQKAKPFRKPAEATIPGGPLLRKRRSRRRAIT